MDLSIEEKISIVKHAEMFNDLDEKFQVGFALIMSQRNFEPGNIVLEENHLSEYFYLVVSGEFEVSKQYKGHKMILGLLEKGDIFGIVVGQEVVVNAMATVETLTPATVLTIAKSEFHNLLKIHPKIQENLNQKKTTINKINFFRLLTPFKKLPHETMEELIQDITEKYVKKGETIIKEGDIGHECYFIVSGQADVISEAHNKVLARLSEGSLFGEMALLSETVNKRNASVIATEDCKLFVLSDTSFKKYMGTHAETEELILFALKNRARPIAKKNVHISKYTFMDGEVGYIFKNPENNKYVKVSDLGLFVFEALNGENTMRDLITLLYEKKGVISPVAASHAILEFEQAGMVTNMPKVIKTSKESITQGLFTKIMTARYQLPNPDLWVSKIYNSVAKYFFTAPFLILIFLIMGAGAFCYIYNMHDATRFLAEGQGSYWLLLATIPLSSLAVVLHELAHAMVCKHFKRSVHGFGMGWYWVTAIAFCDTTDMWMATRRERIWVNLAGCINDLTLGSIVSIIAFLIPSPTISLILWLFSTLTLVSFVANLNPILDFDGYYILMDYFDKPHLRQDALVWLIHFKSAGFKQKNTKPVVSYWLACIFYIMFNISAVFLFQSYVIFPLLHQMGVGSILNVAKWFLPFLVMIIPLWILWSEVRRKLGKGMI